MSIDRRAALRQPENLVRQRKLDQAITEYSRLMDDQPQDWNTANVLGDLYVGAGQADAGDSPDLAARIARLSRTQVGG